MASFGVKYEIIQMKMHLSDATCNSSNATTICCLINQPCNFLIPKTGGGYGAMLQQFLWRSWGFICHAQTQNVHLCSEACELDGSYKLIVTATKVRGVGAIGTVCTHGQLQMIWGVHHTENLQQRLTLDTMLCKSIYCNFGANLMTDICHKGTWKYAKLILLW